MSVKGLFHLEGPIDPALCGQCELDGGNPANFPFTLIEKPKAFCTRCSVTRTMHTEELENPDYEDISGRAACGPINFLL